MLDTTTRKRIDDCRDILVGKLPDPKAQIEQITIALIYKFMDDMDKEAIELGGKAKFFSGSFEKYSWDNLFDTKVTANEMLTLYSDAIAAMDKNPNIPQLFRDIFKNAFLPYRDPETLKLFLKTIGEFEYTHSEKLGDAFEYLLSVMGSQGDAGQFRTPRHIIDFLVAVVDPSKTDTILDPACGTAGFLISAFKHIKEKNNHELTPDERKRLIQNFVGYDISPDMVRLSLVNLYLHGFSDPHIWEYDTLSSEDRWNETFDAILANPPFMSPKGGIRPHKKFSISSNRSEVLFVDYIAEHLNPKGKAGIIVPEGVIFQSGTAYKDLRKMLVDNYLYAVVSLPAGVFNPYSGVKTSILLMDKEFAKTNEEILFVKIDNDGYGLGAQRNAVKGSQLDEAIEVLKQFKEGTFTESVLAHSVPKAEIAKNGDYNLSGERYKIKENVNSKFDWVCIGDVVNLLTDGDWIESKDQSDEGIRLIQTGNIGIGEFKDKEDKSRFISEDTFQRLKCTEVFPNDVLVSRLPDPVGRACLVPNLNSKLITAVDCSIIRFNETKLLPKLFVNYTKIDKYYESIAPCLTGSSRSRISRKNLETIQIPIPPLSVQEEIVAEIESYQKIIDGAKMVVENYKPKIDPDSYRDNADWEMVELGEVCEVNPKKSELANASDKLEVSFVPMADLNENEINFQPKQVKPLGEVIKGYTYFKEDDVLLAKVTPCFENGKAGIAKGLVNGIGFGSSEYFVLRPNVKILSTWIYLNIITNSFREKGKLNMTGTGGLQRVPPDFIKSTLIPLPDIETQRQIVSRIVKEQELVNANKQLIELFEQKIKDRIAKVWDTATSLTAIEYKTVRLTEQVLGKVAEPIAKYKTGRKR